MIGGQAGTVCPQCGSADAVHSIEELAAFAQAKLGELQGYMGQPQGGAPQAGAGQGWAADPQPGPPQGWAGQPQPGPPQPGPQQGWAAQPQAGPPPGRGGRRGWQPSRGPRLSSGSGSLEDDIAGAAIGAVAGLIGRSIGRRIQRAVNEQVLPTIAARSEAQLRTQIEAAQRYPDLRACFKDEVVFLAGGSRVLPAPKFAGGITMEQVDAIVAQLREG